MKNTLALVLMVFGLVGCATTTFNKAVFSQASKNVSSYFQSTEFEIISDYADLKYNHKIGDAPMNYQIWNGKMNQ